MNTQHYNKPTLGGTFPFAASSQQPLGVACNGMKKGCDYTGMRFGILTVLRKTSITNGQNNRHGYSWLCLCDCGRLKNAIPVSFTKATSCGCRQAFRSQNLVHGLSKHPLYSVWIGMRTRCESGRKENYGRYGARGISVCAEWMDFRPFYDWATSNGWQKGLQVDRIDNDGNYGPENCRIVTPKANNNNKANNTRVVAFGMTKNVTQWSEDERCCVSQGTLRNRLSSGWNPEVAITKPSRKTAPTEHNNQTT